MNDIVEELRNKQSRDNRALLDRAAERIEKLERLVTQIASETAHAFYAKVRYLAIKNVNFEDAIEETCFLDWLEGILGEFTEVQK